MSKYLLNNKTLVIASHNSGKILEFKSLFSEYDVNIITASDLNISEVEESGETFEKNSILKAQSVPESHICLSDDSGLCIDSMYKSYALFIFSVLVSPSDTGF